MLNTQPTVTPTEVQLLPPPVKLPLIDLEGIAMIWLRDMNRLWRQRPRLYSSIARALIWLFALGFGLRRSFVPIGGLSYEQFVFPGVIAMTIIFSGLLSAISIVYDREFGFLKEVLVAPTPRSTLILGKCLGGASSSTVQAAIILIFAPLAGVALTPLNVLATSGTMFITALALSSLGIVIAIRVSDIENFGTIQNFITLPLYLFSGAVFPTRGVPGWLGTILVLNPLTYGVNAIRGSLLGYNAASVPFDLAVLGAFTVVMMMIAILMSRREV
ncbi:MAG: ABC transporter permease [Ktedonobacteraceae bacterium]